MINNNFLGCVKVQIFKHTGKTLSLFLRGLKFIKFFYSYYNY